jgi:hypothetical protein
VKRSHPLRSLAILASLPLFALLFWMTALLVSNVPDLLVVGVNVHGLSLANYAGDSAQRPAPVSLRVLDDAQQDASGASASTVPATPSPIPSGRVQPTPSHTASPTPSPSPTVGLPLPTPSPLPSPTPTPGAASIGGQVTDSLTRVPIVAGTVSLSPGGATTQTDANGNFSLGVNAGTYTVAASAIGYSSASQTVTVGSGKTVNVNFRLVLITAYGSLAGTVTDGATKSPIPAATVSLSDGMIRVTDLNGNFAYSIVLNGTYTLTVSAVGYVAQSQVVTIRAGKTTNVQIALVHA